MDYIADYDILLTDYPDILWPEPPEEFYDLLGRGWLDRHEEENDESGNLLPDDLFEI